MNYANFQILQISGGTLGDNSSRLLWKSLTNVPVLNDTEDHISFSYNRNNLKIRMNSMRCANLQQKSCTTFMENLKSFTQIDQCSVVNNFKCLLC